MPTECDFFWGDADQALSERIKETVDGALKRLPKDELNLVVVVPTLLFDASGFQVVAAMFSFPEGDLPA